MSHQSRGQLVLAAAAVVAIALAPVVLAYLQLGYHGDVQASGDYTSPAWNGQRVLDRAVHEAAVGIPIEYDWSKRDAAVRDVQKRLEPRMTALESARVIDGTAYRIGRNSSVATDWATKNCPGGPNRQFGRCEAIDGVVVQNRAGETHVVAVAFDLRITTRRGWIREVVVLRVGG